MDELTAETDLIGMTADIVSAFVSNNAIAADALPANYHPAVASGFVRVRVADTGCGMTSETLAHIFDAFFTTKAAGEGTGGCEDRVRRTELTNLGGLK